MDDIFYLAVTILFFVLTFGLIALCERLADREPGGKP